MQAIPRAERHSNSFNTMRPSAPLCATTLPNILEGLGRVPTFWETFAVYERLTVVGATGAVGRLVLQLLEEREFPYEKIRFLASARSAGKTVTFKGKQHPVEV